MINMAEARPSASPAILIALNALFLVMLRMVTLKKFFHMLYAVFNYS